MQCIMERNGNQAVRKRRRAHRQGKHRQMERSVRGQTGTLKWRGRETDDGQRQAWPTDGRSVAKGATATRTRDMGRVIAGYGGLWWVLRVCTHSKACTSSNYLFEMVLSSVGKALNWNEYYELWRKLWRSIR